MGIVSSTLSSDRKRLLVSRLLQNRLESYAGYICVLLLTSSALSFGDADGKILTALEDWLQSQTLTEVVLDHSDYDVDLKSLPALSQSFSVPAMSATIVRSRMSWRVAKVRKNSSQYFGASEKKSDSVEGLVALKDIRKGEQVFEKNLIPKPQDVDPLETTCRNFLEEESSLLRETLLKAL